MSSLAADLRDAVRALRRNPAVHKESWRSSRLRSAWVNTAVFSVMNAVLLDQLKYNDPGRLVWVAKVEPAMHAEIAAGADYLNWRDQARSLSAIAAWDEAPGLTLLGAGDPERLVGAHVSASFLPLLGGRARTRSRLRTARNVLAPPPLPSSAIACGSACTGPGENIRERPCISTRACSRLSACCRGRSCSRRCRRRTSCCPLRLDEATERQRQMMSIVHVIGRLGAGSTIPRVRSELTAIWRRGEQRTRVASEPRLDPDVGSTAPEGTAPDVVGAPSSDSFDIPIGAPAPATGVDQTVRPFERRDRAEVSRRRNVRRSDGRSGCAPW